MKFAEYKNGDLNEQDFCGLNGLWSEWLDPEKKKQESMIHGFKRLSRVTLLYQISDIKRRERERASSIMWGVKSGVKRRNIV